MVLIILLIFLNQLVKKLVVVSGLPITKNYGLSFGLFSNWKSINLIFISLLVLIIYLYFSKKINNSVNKYAVTLIIAGGMSNLIDRIIDGYVSDYLFLKMLGVFNFSDLMINLGIILLVIGILFFERGQRPSREV